MNLSVKHISIENRGYYFVDDIMYIKKKNLIYCIGYVTIKKYRKNYSVNPLHLIFRNVNGYFEEINENKYLTLEKIKKL